MEKEKQKQQSSSEGNLEMKRRDLRMDNISSVLE